MINFNRLLRAGWRGIAALVAGVALSSAALADTITYFHNDIVGSPVAATNEARQVLWREGYRPYGERLQMEPASAANEIFFASRKEDPRTELVYMGARHYDSRVGRFMATDPVGFDEGNLHSFNRYAYANNNPYKYRDPDGRAVESLWDLASFALSIGFFKDDPTLLNFLGVAVEGSPGRDGEARSTHGDDLCGHGGLQGVESGPAGSIPGQQGSGPGGPCRT